MSVWVEGVDDAGSAVWGCTSCATGGWCDDRPDAWTQARTHARGHGTSVVAITARRRGPRPSPERDDAVRRLTAEGLTIRAIAAQVGLSTAGVLLARKRIQRQDQQ